MMKIKRYKLLLLFLLLRGCVMAQTEGYHYKADLGEIRESGFYNVELSPKINSYLKDDNSDFRIINDSGKWIPSFIRDLHNSPGGIISEKEMYKVKRESSPTNTTLIVATNQSSISRLWLNIKNTEAERFCNITGSDDLINWFIINDSIAIKPKNHSGDNSHFLIFFPEVNYKYLKIYINNNKKAPFNIISISKDTVTGMDRFIEEALSRPDFENPANIVVQKDSGNLSYIKIVQPAAYRVDALEIAVNGSKFYERHVKVYKPASVNASFKNLGEYISSLTLSNNSTLRFNIHAITKAKEFYLVIENNDNPPLKIERVKTLSKYTVATAWLEKGKYYSIIMDNLSANEPNYDIPKKDFPFVEKFEIAQIGKITPIHQTTAPISPTKNNKGLIWSLIFIAIIVLGFFTYKLITDINKSKS